MKENQMKIVESNFKILTMELMIYTIALAVAVNV